MTHDGYHHRERQRGNRSNRSWVLGNSGGVLSETVGLGSTLGCGWRALHIRSCRSLTSRGSGQLLSCALRVWKNTSEVSRTKLACAVASVLAQSTPVFFAASTSRSSRFWSTFS